MPYMVHIVQRTVGAFMSSLSVKGHTMSWEAHQCNLQFGENNSIDIGRSQRFGKKGNDGINMVLAMKPGLVKIIDKVHISSSFESSETDLQIAANARCINYADTGFSEMDH